MRALDLLNCEIGTVSSRKDKSVRFSVETAELTAEQSGILMSYHGIAARVLVAPHAGGDVEIEQVAEERDTRTPSARMRAVLFLLWKHEKSTAPFNQFYEARCEKIIEHLKSKLNQ